MLSAKATATREKILQTANDLFYQHGYNATGLDAIISNAGITKGNFYYYFKSKEILGIEVLEWHFESLQKSFQEVLKGKNLPPLETLFTILDVLDKRHENQYATGNISGCFFGNFSLELSSGSPAVQKKLENIFNRLKGTFIQLIEEAQVKGQLSVSMNPEREAQTILSLTEGALLLDKARQKPQALKQAIDFLKTHLSG